MNLKMYKISFFFFLMVFITQKLSAEMWIDTRDSWLRADIEQLSDAGVIKVPITTWPLMWAPILRDLENADLNPLSQNQLQAYRRVKRKGKYETKLTNNSYLSLKAGNQGRILRHFGDDRREKAEITSKNTGVSKNFTWNIEATKTLDPIDGEEQRLDNSYVATVWGNWIFSAGAQERWWGPGWDSSLILSNNARPVPAISIQRNYSDPFETKWLSWMGPWTMNAFAGQLESARFVKHAKFLGMSVSFKPFDSLEIGLRRTAQWGGEGRPENFSNFIDLLIGLDNCDEGDLSCTDRSNEPGNQLAGVDFKWLLPLNYPITFYGQLIGEDEAGYAPSRKISQLGVKSKIDFGWVKSNIYLEYSDTTNDFGPNITYNNGIYQTGYRFEQRSIGSTYDNDTKSITLGLLGYFEDGSNAKLTISSVALNQDNGNGTHSINQNAVDFTNLEIQYRYPTKYGLFKVSLDAKGKVISNIDTQKDKYNLTVSWAMEL